MSDYADFAAASPQGTLFCQPWWLEAVAPGQYQVVEVRTADGLQAAWPLALKRRPLVGRVLGMPPLTPYLGPLLPPLGHWGAARRLSFHGQLLETLAQQLPPAASLDANCHPDFEWWMPLHWRGFEATTWYTHAVPAPIEPKAVWSGMRDKVQWSIRKAGREGLTVDSCDRLDEVWPVWEATFRRQGRGVPVSRADFERVDVACRLREARTILLARDPEGLVQGFAYFVHDHRSFYYLAGGAHPDTRQSGVQSLLLWHGIERAAERGLAFDFEGSISEPIERFFRGFGTRPRPYLVIYQDRHPLSFLVRLGRTLRRSRKPPRRAE